MSTVNGCRFLTSSQKNRKKQLRSRSEMIGGWGGFRYLSNEKPKKFDPPQTFGKLKNLTLPENHPKNCDLPLLEVQWPFLLQNKGTFRDVNNSSGELPVHQLGLQIVLVLETGGKRLHDDLFFAFQSSDVTQRHRVSFNIVRDKQVRLIQSNWHVVAAMTNTKIESDGDWDAHLS